MNAPAAFSGDYTDLRFIKTRSVAAITIEIPIEQAADFVAAFGAPVPSSGCPVAIARIQPSIVREQLEASVALLEKPEKERRRFSELPLSQQAAMRCNEPAFWRFLSQSGKMSMDVESAKDAAEAVRIRCNVKSRAEIAHGSFAGNDWMNLNDAYEAWGRF